MRQLYETLFFSKTLFLLRSLQVSSVLFIYIPDRISFSCWEQKLLTSTFLKKMQSVFAVALPSSLLIIVLYSSQSWLLTSQYVKSRRTKNATPAKKAGSVFFTVMSHCTIVWNRLKLKTRPSRFNERMHTFGKTLCDTFQDYETKWMITRGKKTVKSTHAIRELLWIIYLKALNNFVVSLIFSWFL